MTIYRQLGLAVLFSALAALAVSLFAALYHARQYLETQLAEKNRDNAAALALALSRPDTTAADVAAAAAALFASGQYALVQVIDVQGRPIADHTRREQESGAPAWFVELMPIRALPGEAQISAGWVPIGTVTLLSDSRFAYAALWKTAISMTATIVIAGFICLALVGFILGRLRQPMRDVIEQARAITEHRFITIPEPKAPELKQLAAAMNDTVTRLRQYFEDEARRFEVLRREANFDPLTGLANRNFFLASLDHALSAEDSLYGGLAIVRLPELAALNRERGRETTDQVLRAVGRTLSELSPQCLGIYAGRLAGADFGLMLPAGCAAEEMLVALMDDIARAIEPIAARRLALAIGHTPFSRGESPARVLARVDAALAAAESAGGQTIRLTPPDAQSELPVSAEEWRAALRRALQQGQALKLVHHDLRTNDAMQIHHECPLRIRLDANSDWLPASRFLPLAERLGLVQELDLAALELALAELEAQPELDGLWLNLSARSIADPEFRRQMLRLLERHPDAARRLWLEIPEAGGLRQLPALRELARSLKPLGAHLGLEHYGHHFNQIGLLYDLGLDFLKVDSSFIQDVDQNPGNQAFLAGLCEIAHRIGMKVYAEGVETAAERACLKTLGFDGVTGAAVRESQT